ncbi:hypothetical protein QJS04_geneDACA002446 [Acorus gramineus]|uniref:Uncharacterized protein n=1 Tax=Acorus gramineus TaxID=55184 RepID=A0AAV9A7Z5_ACOGR|nr:hypothetical protein QJS04_geneDACA002446 [Acorus gramineus]
MGMAGHSTRTRGILLGIRLATWGGDAHKGAVILFWRVRGPTGYWVVKLRRAVWQEETDQYLELLELLRQQSINQNFQDVVVRRLAPGRGFSVKSGYEWLRRQRLKLVVTTAKRREIWGCKAPLKCPKQCPQRKPRNNLKVKGCFIDCSSRCETTCKFSKWNDSDDALFIQWDGKEVFVPTNEEAEWRAPPSEEYSKREVVVERTDITNSVKVTVEGLLEMDIKVTPIGEEEDRVHGYHLPSDDAFAHLEMQFKFPKLTDKVEGVLGKTYRPDYVSPVKIGVPMPMMGGEDKYRTPSFLSTVCAACHFKHPNSITTTDTAVAAATVDVA